MTYTFFFFNDPATTEIYTLSLHDALPIFVDLVPNLGVRAVACRSAVGEVLGVLLDVADERSEEHTSELQSRVDLVCRLLLEKKNTAIVKTPLALILEMHDQVMLPVYRQTQ